MLPLPRIAVRADIDAVVELCARYANASHGPHSADGFDRDAARECLAELVHDDRFGIVWVAERGAEIVGYLLLTWGYSLESGGRDALVDEIYVEPRDQGIGSMLVESAVAECVRRGIRRLFLETELENGDARRLYVRHGFAPEDSIWMSRWISPDRPIRR